MKMNDYNAQLDDIASGGFTKADSPEVKTRGRKRKEPVDKPTITVEQISLVTTGMFVMIEGFSKLPLRTTDPKLKAGFDEAAANVANQYIPEDFAKYVPLAQLSLSMMYIVLDAYERKKKGELSGSESVQ